MGSSHKEKKHKEKRDRKKHKRDRSRDRDGHKKAHKSSHRREKRKSPEHSDQETETLLNKGLTAPIETPVDKPSVVEDDFDVDELLDSKLSENAELSAVLKRSPTKKRRREGAIEELKRRQNLGVNEDSLEKFATEQMLEEHGVGHVGEQKRNRSPSQEGVRIKEEHLEGDVRGGSITYT